MKVLPFFTSTGMRDAERVSSWCPILCPDYKLLPFQVQRPHLNSTGFSSLVLVDCDGNETDITANIETVVSEKTTYDFITYNGQALAAFIDWGTYYLRVIDETTTWFSDWFSVRNLQPNLLTDWPNETYDTWTVVAAGSYEDIGITQAITASTALARTNTFPVHTGEIIIVTTEFIVSVGSPVLEMKILDSGLDTISNIVNPTDGTTQAHEFIITSSNTAARLQISNASATTFRLDRTSIRRKAGEFIHLEYTNIKDFNNGDESILYQDGFTQQAYLDTRLGPPTHEPIEFGDDKHGVFQAEKIVSKYIHNFIAYESHAMFNALRLLPLHSTIKILDRTGIEYTPSVGNVTIDVDWNTFDTGSLRVLFNEVGVVWTNNADDII